MKRITTYNVKLIKEECHLYDLPDNVADSSSKAGNIIQTVLDLNSSTVEKFGMLCLDAQKKIIGIHIISIGGLAEATIDMRSIFQRALLNNSHSIIVFHNHPGGGPKPSLPDIDATKRIKEAGRIMGIELIDHIICADEGSYTSFAEQGLL